MLSFDVVSNDTLNKSLTINVVNEVSLLNFGLFLDRFYDSLMIIKLNSSIAHRLVNSYHLISYGNELGNYIFKDGILFQIFEDYFGILEINNNRQKLVLCLNFNIDPSSMIIELIPKDSPVTESIDMFTMKPPTATSSIKKQIVSPEQVSDPFKYIKQRYYNLLYSPTIPLSYFPKTAVSRLKVITEDKTNFRECLLKILLSQENLNERHAGELGLLKQLNQSVDNLEKDFEIEVQKDFIFKEQLSASTKTLLNAVSLLKLRESQLQMIILLEILISLDFSEEKFLLKDNTPVKKSTESQTSKKIRPSLIRNKNKPRKIIPTFLGMGVGINNFPSKESKSAPTKPKDILSSSELLDCLNHLLERLRLLDSLSTETTDSFVNFVAYVLVPYYKNKLPLTIKYIVGRIKESTLKFKDHKEKEKRSRDPIEDKVIKRKNSSGSGTTNNSHTSNKPTLSSSSKHHLSSSATYSSRSKSVIERPRLNLNEQTFAPQILKRSNSNLSSKNLQRRQVDLSNLKSKSMTELNSSIFGQPKKKSTAILQRHNAQPLPKTNIPQVAATPIKPKKSFQTTIQKPSNEEQLGPPINISTLAPAIQVNQTPMKQHSQQSILLSPIVSPVIQRSEQQAGRRDSSSQYGSKLGDNLSLNSTILSSPVFAPNKRPGEPVEFLDSSFGSPQQLSIFKRNKARKKS